jgi:hypothetical protein
VLLALDRAAEALPLFESLAELGEALEGRARALRRLGRDAEAEAALDRYVTVTGCRRGSR